MLMFWLIEGKLDTPKSDMDKFRLELQNMEKRINTRFDNINIRIDNVEKKLRERIY